MSSLGKVIKRFKRDGIGGASRHYLRVLKNAFERFLKKSLLPLIIRMERKLPLKDYIVFECENDMDDNPRAVYEYLLKTGWNNNHKLIWVVRDVNTCKTLYYQKNVVFLSRFDQSFKNQVQLEYFLSTAKWLVFSHPYWFRKRRPEQIVIHINHQTPFKGVSKVDDPNLGERFDYLLSDSHFSVNGNCKFWNCKRDKVIICGHPRNDFLLEGEKTSVFSPLFEWHQNDHVIICMPTYKQSRTRTDSTRPDPYSLDVIGSKDDLIELNQFLAERHTHLLVKPHPLQKLDQLCLESLSNIHYISNKELLIKRIVLYKLIGCCDGLITDVSSVFLDFMLINRPIGFLMNNVTEYDRGFIYDNPEQYMAGEKIYSMIDLKRFIEDTAAGIDRYSTTRRIINNMIHDSEQESNSERFLEILFSM